MGFKLEFNYILRTNVKDLLKEGKEYAFEKEDSRIYADNVQIWLIKNDWTALAEIQITRQTRTKDKVIGTYKVLHLYSPQEQIYLTAVFKRMYGWI